MSAVIDVVGRVYAQSLFDLARTAGGDDAVCAAGDELDALVEITRSDRTFREFFASPVIDRTKRAASIETIFKGRVSDLFVRFLLVLNEKGRLGEIEGIAAAFAQVHEESFGRLEVTVYTVDGKALTGEELASATTQVKKVTGRDPVFHTIADPKMIGGIKLRIGDQLVDGSIATRLSRLRTQLVESGGARIRADIDHYLA